MLEIPGVKDPDLVKKYIKSTAQLEFRLVPKGMTIETNSTTGAVTASRNGQPISTEQALSGMMLGLSGGRPERNQPGHL